MGATCSALWSVADGDGALLRDQLTTEHTIMRSRAAHVSLIGLLVVLSGVGARASLRTDAKGYADAFAEHLATVAHDASATEALQTAYASYSYSVPSRTLRQTFDDLLASLEDKITSRNDAVRTIQQAVAEGCGARRRQRMLQGGDTQCCHVRPQDVEYSSFFQADVDMTSTCVRYADGVAASNDMVHDTQCLEGVIESLFDETPTLKWSYFGSEDGGFRIYPAKQRESCSDYDPRFRPWYVSAATPEPKDIVIIIDSSGSMIGSRMDKAKEAAKVVLSTLNPNDYVALVDFDTTARTADGCFNDGMAKATPQNLAALKQFVDDDILADQGTGYVAALTKAFDLLEADAQLSSGGRKAILFLTDGVPSDEPSAIHALLEARNPTNDDGDQEVSLLTFLLGDADASALLEDMASQNSGEFLEIPDDGDLRSAMGRYYSFFSSPDMNQDVVYAPPYFDSSGLGIITTAALPVVGSGGLEGVVGVDLTLEDLVADAALFGAGDTKSYAFITDTEGNVLVHPALPNPASVSSPPVVMHISQLERATGFVAVADAMMSRQSGSTDLEASVAKSRGLARTEGVDTDTFDATYYYGPIEGTPFSLCVVAAHTDMEVPRLSDVPKPDFDEAFVYHRLDVLSESACDDGYICPDCAQFDTKATAAASSVKFAPAVFRDPTYYSQAEEDSNMVRSFVNWMSADLGSGSPPTAMEDPDAVKLDVWATAAADEVYRDTPEIMDRALWRYVATPKGVFRSYPAHPSTSTYDPRERPWWHRALAHPEALAVSTPYTAASAGATVVTVSNIIRRGGNDAAPLEAVTGVDFTLGNLQAIMDSVFDCRAGGLECILVDSAGLIVLNDDLLFAAPGARVSDVFIGDAYPAIAADLVDKDVLVREACNDFQAKHEAHMYKLSTDAALSAIDVGSCTDGNEYALAPIPGTNIFLLALAVSDTCQCFAGLIDDEVTLGTTDLRFDDCAAEFELTAAQRAWPTCPPDTTSSTAFYDIEPADASSASCFEASCLSITSASVCLETLGCALCSEADPSVEADCRVGSCDAGDEDAARPTVRCGSATDRGTARDDDTDDSGSSQADLSLAVALLAAIAVLIQLDE